MPFSAKYSGWCVLCHQRFHPGDEIELFRSVTGLEAKVHSWNGAVVKKRYCHATAGGTEDTCLEDGAEEREL